MKFLLRARWLYRLVLIQHAVRLILRAVWLGGAVYLLCWGIHAWWGVLPDPAIWIGLSSLVGLLTLLTIFFKRKRMEDFLWRADRLFSQKEQLSTAYQAAVKKHGDTGSGEVTTALISDAAKLIPAITRRVLARGWRLRNDLEAAIIVGLLILVVYISGLEALSTSNFGSELGLIPAAGSDPSFGDVFPSGIPGDTRGGDIGAAGEAGEGEDGPVSDQPWMTASALDRLFQVFSEMGAQLKDTPPSADLGRALELGDLLEASNQLGELSENIDRLTGDTRRILAEAFAYGARELYLSEFDQITGPLGSAADALENKTEPEMGVALDQLAAMFEALAAQLQGEVTAQQQAPEPISERIAGEGEDLELTAPEDISDLLVAPGRGEAGSGEALGEAVSLTEMGTESTGEVELSQFNYLWANKDVVSTYFSPR